MSTKQGKLAPATLPQVAIQLIRLATDPEVNFQALAGTIQTDPAIAAAVLQAANSSRFGGQTHVYRIDHAIVRLGLQRTLGISITFSLVRRSIDAEGLSRVRHEMWLRCVTQAMAAEWFSKHKQYPLGETPFVVGLLLDIGRLLLFDESPDDYEFALEYQRAHDGTLVDVERKVLHDDHAAYGARFLAGMELPEVFVDAVRRHEESPPTAPGISDGDACLFFAAGIGELMFGSDIQLVHPRLMEWGESLSLFSPDEIVTAISNISERLRHEADLFFADASLLPNNEQIYAAARIAAKVAGVDDLLE